MRLSILFLLIPLTTVALSFQESYQTPCRNEVTNAFKYFEGTWSISSRVMSSAGWDTTRAESEFIIRQGGCFLEERWKGLMNGKRMEATVIIAYDTKREKCDLVSIDTEHGNINSMEGRYRDSVFVFHHTEMRTGRLLIDRITMRLNTNATLAWKLETSADGGATWRSIWEMDYRKK